MVHIISAVAGSTQSSVRITRALLSVSDKTGLADFARFLVDKGVELLSTGGTAKAIRDAGLPVTDVSDYTGFPEMMDGRVKTLHPKVHGGLLGVRGNEQHEADMAKEGIKPIDLVVLNLYAFEATVASGASFNQCVENIDIGGPSMLRSSAKNHAAVTIAVNPDQYPELMQEMSSDASTSLALRRRFAARAFKLSSAYDTAISDWFAQQLEADAAPPAPAGGAAAAPLAAPVVSRRYEKEWALKYGCNPHQQPAAIYNTAGGKLPFSILNGTPGYINLLDAANAWQLVKEAKEACGLPAAASFKHVSPAGAGLAVPLSAELTAAYECGDVELTPVAQAYLRARGADPMSSFGDFAAVSDVVDKATALVLKREVSDGIVAPGFDEDALEILKAKKGGKFIVLQADPSYQAPENEYREVYGMTFAQRRNHASVESSQLAKVVTTKNSSMSVEQQRDLTLAAVTLKYTQSNSVAFAKDGQCIGVGAGQQSRVDCVKLAGRKLRVWYMRQHPKVQGLKFKAGVKRQERVNARVRYIEGDFSPTELATWQAKFEEVPEPLTEAEREEWTASLRGVALSSDAFFPFRDSIDLASRLGVEAIGQPGGSVADADVVSACDDYNMAMAFTGLRLFHH